MLDNHFYLILDIQLLSHFGRFYIPPIFLLHQIQEERKQQYLRHEISEEEFKAKIIVEETFPEEIFFVEGEEVIEA